MYIPLHTHSGIGSLLDGLNKPSQFSKYCVDYDVPACAISDHGTVSAHPKFYKELSSKGIKPILGSELYLCRGDSLVKDKNDRKLDHLVVLARSRKGWGNLIKLISKSNHPDRFYYKNRLNLEEIREFAEDIIAFSGHPGSQMWNVLFEPGSSPYDVNSYEEALSCLKPDWKKDARKLAEQHISIFGDLFFLEIQEIDKVRLPAARLAAECLRELGEEMKIRRVATCDAHYYRRKDADDQRVLLATALNTTLPKIHSKLNSDEEFGLSGFFKTDGYHIWTPKEMEELHKNHPDEIANTKVIADMCENYTILSKPKLPIFDPTQNSEELLRNICRDKWKNYRAKDGKEEIYGERVRTELGVINKAGLADYFLIVNDIVSFAKSKGYPVGLGRGSAAGSLVLNILGVTAIDPIERGLIFERFYNEGRNSGDNISYPDVDMDFATCHRAEIVEYIRNKFGYDKTGQIATIGRMQGRGALKDVLRAHEACSFDEMNEITLNIPDESAISDALQEMVEAGEDPSIIMWALENNAKDLEPYCILKDDGTLSGQYAQYFAQAIRLEGTGRSQGKHAAGVVISPNALDESVPLIYDKSSKGLISGFEKESAEAMGLLKFDILGVSVLDKIDSVGKFLRGQK